LVSCEKEKDFDKDKVCFKDIVYPFSIQFEDESTMTINTEEEYKNAFSLCDEETEEDVDVVKDEEENEIDWSEDEYDDKPEYIACGFGDCEKEEKDACFDFIYPITVSFSDGSTKSIANEEELWKAKMACKKGKHDYDDK
ncbi:MAG: hypothetical protein ACPG4Z_05530, partial [Chitinophagales bacterium]